LKERRGSPEGRGVLIRKGGKKRIASERRKLALHGTRKEKRKNTTLLSSTREKGEGNTGRSFSIGKEKRKNDGGEKKEALRKASFFGGGKEEKVDGKKFYLSKRRGRRLYHIEIRGMEKGGGKIYRSQSARGRKISFKKREEKEGKKAETQEKRAL